MSKIFDHPYRVVRWMAPDGSMSEEVAQCSHFSLADAAWRAAQDVWPKDEITLLHGIRIMKRSQAHRDPSGGVV